MPIEIAKIWDDHRLKRDRLARVQAEMRKRNVGSLYVSDNATIRYLLAVKVPSARAFVPAEGEVIAFIRPRDAGYVRMVHSLIQDPLYDSASNWGPEAAESAGNEDRLAYGLLDLMAEHGVAGEPLGVDNLDVPALTALQRAGMSLTYAMPIIEHARAVKTPDEIAIYRAMGEQYGHAVRAFCDALRPGISENELAGLVVSAWYEAGGEEVAQLNVCAGENMNPWRRWPTQRTVRAGDLLASIFTVTASTVSAATRLGPSTWVTHRLRSKGTSIGALTTTWSGPWTPSKRAGPTQKRWLLCPKSPTCTRSSCTTTMSPTR